MPISQPYHVKFFRSTKPVNLQLRLVHRAQVNYTETDPSTDLGRLWRTADGYMDEVHQWRDMYGADIVSLFADTIGGRATGIDVPQEYAFAIQNMLQTFFTHEIGHLLGCMHERGRESFSDGYNFAYHFQGESGYGYGTVMTWAGGTIQHFSNPNVLYDGRPTGVDYATDPANAADNARVINENAGKFSAYRVETPSLSGPIYGMKNTSYTFSTTTTFHPTKVYYTFDWGDATTTTTDLVFPGQNIAVSHSWTGNGTYSVKVKATDVNGKVSAWSQQLTVTIQSSDLTLTVYGDTNGWYGQTRNQRALIVNQNQGTASPATTLRVYLSYDSVLDAGDTHVDTYTVQSVSYGVPKRIDYTVPLPTSWPQRLVYVIVQVEPVEESNVSNNTGFRSIGFTKMRYDVDGDGKVTVTDITRAQDSYFENNGNPPTLKWNASADMNGDGLIRVGDINTVAAHYFDVDSQVEAHATASATTILKGQSVTFTYNAHYFYGNVIVYFDLDGNNTWESNTGWVVNETAGTKNRVYTLAGTYNAKIKGVDSTGKSDTITITITVN